MNVRQEYEVRSFTRSGDNGGSQKFLGTLWLYAHAPYSLKILQAFHIDYSCICTHFTEIFDLSFGWGCAVRT